MLNSELLVMHQKYIILVTEKQTVQAQDATAGSTVFAQASPSKYFQNPRHTLLTTFPSFRPMDMQGEACLPNNAYYSRTPDYTLYSGVHVCWSEHSDSSFVYGFMSLDYGFGTMTTNIEDKNCSLLMLLNGHFSKVCI